MYIYTVQHRGKKALTRTREQTESWTVNVLGKSTRYLIPFTCGLTVYARENCDCQQCFKSVGRGYNTASVHCPYTYRRMALSLHTSHP